MQHEEFLLHYQRWWIMEGRTVNTHYGLYFAAFKVNSSVCVRALIAVLPERAGGGFHAS